MKKIGKLILAVGMSCALLAGCSSGGGEKPTLTMGTNAEFPPFEFIGDQGILGQFDGIDVALALQIAEDHGYELRIENMEFDALLAALNSDKVDFIAAGMTIRADRTASADPSIEYYEAIQNIIVMADSTEITEGIDLIGKTVGVQEGTTGDIFCDEEIENCTVTRYKKGADAILALKKGDVDAVVIDSAPAESFVARNDDLRLISDDDFFGNEEYAMWVKKGNQELLDQINETLQKLMDDGTIEALSKQYGE